jgi:16S rRNA (guanine966-N2)-methyltransferase
MRIIAGTARGTPLLTPKTDLRPTMDLVRGAIFSSLGEAVGGARVLDLFAGSGSLALEALSRGAAEAILVEADRKACATIEQNLQKTRLTARIVQADVFRFLKNQARAAHADLVFADPPYSKTPGSRDFAMELLDCADLRQAMAPEGLLILETARSWRLPVESAWECLRHKVYGTTQTWLLRLRLPPDSTPDSGPTPAPASLPPPASPPDILNSREES